MSEQIDNEIESSVVSVPNLEVKVEITNGDPELYDIQTPTSTAIPVQLVPPPPDVPPPGIPPQPSTPPQPPDSEICRDFLKGKCLRQKCKFKHEKRSPTIEIKQEKFCHDFQNGSCSRPQCNYLHGDICDELEYYKTGKLPEKLQKKKEESLSPKCAVPPPGPPPFPSVPPGPPLAPHIKPTLAPRASAVPRAPMLKAATRGPAPRNMTPGSPMTSYLPMDPTVPPPSHVYPNAQPMETAANLYSDEGPYDFNKIKHIPPPTNYKQNKNLSDKMIWDDFEGKTKKETSVENFGSTTVCNKSFGNSYVIPNDIHSNSDEPSMKKARYSKCESCTKISERHEDLQIKCEEVKEKLRHFKDKNNDLILNILVLASKMGSFINLEELLKMKDCDTNTYSGVKNNHHDSDLNKLPISAVNARDESNNTLSINTRRSRIINETIDNSTSLNPMLSSFASSESPNALMLNQQGQNMQRNVMGPNDYQHSIVQMNNQNSFPQSAYNTQSNHIQNTAPTTIQMMTTNQTQQFPQQYTFQGQNMSQTYVNTYSR